MPKAIIIGVDGFDPHIAEEFMNKGKMPAFSYLKKKGSYKRLTTENPSQSPVVWASIATGTNPGGHGLFDFICRDPQTYLPHLAINQKNEKNILGLRSALFKPVHKGIPFWSITSKKDIATTVIKWPVSFPPEKVAGKFLSGLGVPDIKNTLGKYTLYTTKRKRKPEDVKGEIIKLPTGLKNIDTTLYGPERSKLPLKFTSDGERKTVQIKIGEQSKISLKENQWSDWLTLNFRQSLGRDYWGIAKFLVNSVIPELEIYISSIHIDPKKPLFPISNPDYYAKELASEIGDYHTLGLPEETNGLNDTFLSLDSFLDFVNNIQYERELMFWHEYKKFKKGVFAFVFDSLDRIQHMFWFTKDTMHPIYDKKKAKKYTNVIPSYYQQIDKLVSKLIESDDEMLILVVSDHGFGTFRKAVHLNSWLIKEGFMTLKDSSNIGKELFENVDWSKTQAYAVGFSSIYLNLEGREGKGIVKANEVPLITEKIKTFLEKLKDRETNTKVVHRAYVSKKIYRGGYVKDAPDIVIGMASGYRVSWQTAVGAAPNKIVEDNLKQWCGDHLVDPSFVPGVFFCNKKIIKEKPSVYDIAPTILDFFSLSRPDIMEGSSLI